MHSNQEETANRKAADELSVFLPAHLYAQVAAHAQQLGLSPAQVIAAAVESHIRKPKEAIHPPHAGISAAPGIKSPKLVSQGDIYWVQLWDPTTRQHTIPHPYVIIQDDIINHSRIETVVGCALTTNLSRAGETPGNLLLDPGEANLPRQSVVEVSKITSIPKAEIGDYIGTLEPFRINQIHAGLRFLQAATLHR